MPAVTTEMPVEPPPRVSIGLPVYNGENYLNDAIAAILAQDFTDFELNIRDNASTDRTAAICRAHAARDRRVRYRRNDRNLGAGPNYDLCFHDARGEFFKWMAHDDLIAPDFLRRTVERLERDPDAVLCCIDVREIGPDGEPLREFASAFAEVEGADTATRFAAAIRTDHICTDFFGLFRREALLGTQLHGTYRGSDRALLAEVALRGRFVRVPAPLLCNREHDARYSRTVMRDRKRARQWLGASVVEGRRFHEWILYRRYFTLVRRYVSNPRTRWICYRHLLGWPLHNRNGWHLLKDMLWGSVPALIRPLGRIKRKLRPPRRRSARRSATTSSDPARL
jgi:glycosyltransferase involved in cell wall biosynthesis